jgi:hypothetical protein
MLPKPSMSIRNIPLTQRHLYFRWYMTFVMMAAEMRLAVNFPVGDLSHFWPKTDVALGDAEKQA